MNISYIITPERPLVAVLWGLRGVLGAPLHNVLKYTVITWPFMAMIASVIT